MAILPVTVGLDSSADDFSERRKRLAAERAIDKVLADSFPASDPPSRYPGVSQLEPVRLACPRRRSLTPRAGSRIGFKNPSRFAIEP